MGLIVQKYGGTSVKDAERVMNVARRITDAYKAGNNVVVAVSAQGDTTDDLIENARKKLAAKKQDSGLKHSKPSRIAMPKRSMRFWKPRRAA